jgi:hypothetical protein
MTESREAVTSRRVFAVRDATNEVVNLFGFGNYVGDYPRSGWDNGERQEYERIIREMSPDVTDDDLAAQLHRLSLNPRIELDNGNVVWGCECWWSAESGWDDFLKGREVVNV